MFTWTLIIGLIFGLVAFGVSKMLASPDVVTPVGDGYYRYNRPKQPTFHAMGWLGGVIGVSMVLFISWAGAAVGSNWAKGELLTYNEFWNGYETEAIHLVDDCEYNGSCRHTYDCDPYLVAHTTTDSKGNTSTYYTTEYNSCPYATQEWTFKIKTSLKTEYTIVDGGFTDNPVMYRGDSGLPDHVHRGYPQFWLDAKARIESGDPGPITEQRQYDNYILASQNSILKEFSTEKDKFQSEGKIPKIAGAANNAGITSPYLGNKAYFVVGVPNQDQWTASVNRFNAALGSTLQGDMHLVFVDHNVDPHAYEGALNAAWTGPDLGRNALSKNGLVIIVGVNGDNGEWVRAFTGMPVGNETLLKTIENLKDIDLNNPATVLGNPKGVINEEGKVKEAINTNGSIEELVWGPNKFQRVCMACQGPEDAGAGFVYLDADIEPTGGQVAAVVLLNLLLIGIGWAVIVAVQIPNPHVGSSKEQS
jgi:hypothetical protein